MQSIPLMIVTSGLSLFHILTKASVTAEIQLMIDLKTVKESYKKGELHNVAYSLFKQNVANPVIKIRNLMYLINVLDKAKIKSSRTTMDYRKEMRTLCFKERGMLG